MNRTRRGAFIAATAALALGLSACGGNGDGDGNGGGDGAGSSDPIKIGLIADLTGATGDVGTPYNQGMLAYIEYRNANGGVADREIEAISNDYAYEVPKAEQLYKQYVNDGVVAVQGWGTG